MTVGTEIMDRLYCFDKNAIETRLNITSIKDKLTGNTFMQIEKDGKPALPSYV